LPELAGKFDGMAVRVPTPCVSLVDLVAKLRRNVTIEKIANLFIGASRGEMKGILAVESLPLVSSDFIGNKHSAIVDLEEIMVLKGDMVKVIAWYDNEWGYSERLVDLAVYLGKFLK
jgi:glyceraldehyde 3-phosphate dehydrogenase